MIRVVLREPLDLRHPRRDVTYKDPVFTDGEDLNHLDGAKNHATSGGSLDVNLAEVNKGDGGYAEIRFVLADIGGKYDFVGSGLSLGGADNIMGFCGPRFVEIDANNRLVAELFVRLNQKSGALLVQDLQLDLEGKMPGRYWGPHYVAIRIMNNAPNISSEQGAAPAHH